MKTSKSRLISGTVLALATAVSLGGCTYHRTVVEAAPPAPPQTIVVPQQTQPNTIIVPERTAPTVVVPESTNPPDVVIVKPDNN